MESQGPLQRFLIAIVLVAACIVIYGQTVGHGFVCYDDDRFITRNVQVQSGLSWKTVVWAFTNDTENYLIPLSWLSHALDCQVYGLWAGGHHLTNLILHAINAILVFWVLRRFTGAQWESAIVAALFAVHPLHVESVAWVSERKDVLSTLFWSLTLLAYASYVAKTNVRRYLLVVGLFVLALMAKPMVVTLPCLLLLLDYWPLGRIRFDRLDASVFRLAAKLVLEKLPLFGLAVADSASTILFQPHLDRLLHGVSLSDRVGNVLVTYAFFLVKAVVPMGLSPSYPWPIGGFPVWQIAGASLLLIAVTALVLLAARDRPYLVTGWFWYLVVLVPTSQLFQRYQFPHARADRYMYCALIGIGIMVVWGGRDILVAWRAISGARRSICIATAAIAPLVALTALAVHQTGYWRDSEVLFRHAVRVTGDNIYALNNLGMSLMEQGRYEEAKTYFDRTLIISPEYDYARQNLALALFGQGRYEEAARYCAEFLEEMPGNVDALNYMGLCLLELRRYEEARPYLEKALAVDPGRDHVLNNMGLLFLRQNQYEDAKRYFLKTLAVNPQYVKALNNLGLCLLEQQRYEEARPYLERALAINPGYDLALDNMGLLFLRQDQYEDAKRYFLKTLSVNPQYVDALNNLGLCLLQQRHYKEAETYLDRALAINPASTLVLNNMGLLFLRQDQYEDAKQYFLKVLAANPRYDHALNNMGLTLLREGHYEEAERYLLMALQVNPQHANALYNLSEVCERQGRSPEAEGYLRKTLEIEPKSVEALNALGRILERQGREEEAASFSQRASQIKSGSRP